MRKKIQSGDSIDIGKLQKLKQLTSASIQLNAQLAEAKEKYDYLKIEVENNEAGMIKVFDTVYPGTKIVISNVIYYVKDPIQHSKFVRDRADIKVVPL